MNAKTKKVNEMTKKIKFICDHCGSDDITIDVATRWDIDAQDWRIDHDVEDTYCENCESARNLLEVTL